MEGGDCEVRIHIWDPRLVKPGIIENGDMHDHRFNMTSHVLVGSIVHEEHLAYEDPDGPWEAQEVQHARLAEQSNFHGTVTDTGKRYGTLSCRWTIPAGWSYTFESYKFHRTIVEGPAITLVEKTDISNKPATVLHPIGSVVHAFGHDIDPDLVQAVLKDARASLWTHI